MDSRIAQILHEANLKQTRQRMGILSVLLDSPTLLTAEEIYLKLSEQGQRFGLSTVYRTLSTLQKNAAVETLFLPGDSTQYFLLSQGGHSHQLICVGCRRRICVEECPVEHFSACIAQKNGFRALGHSFQIFGLCPGCQETGKPLA